MRISLVAHEAPGKDDLISLMVLRLLQRASGARSGGGGEDLQMRRDRGDGQLQVYLSCLVLLGGLLVDLLLPLFL